MNAFKRSSKIRTKVTRYGDLRNSLARKTSTAAQQVTQAAGYYDQVCLCAMQAWDRLTPPSGLKDPAFSP